jgi:MAE_28990/MAE_18760-like HEPN
MTEIVFSSIAANIDTRRLEITRLRRIIVQFSNSTLETTVVRMSIPMLYAHWEGCVKETCQIYIEYIEDAVPTAGCLKPAILGYLWTYELRKLSGGVGFDKKHSIAKLALTALGKPVCFRDAERTVDTKSNLNFDALEEISKHLCLDISSLREDKRHLDALVNLRNNIAHGANPSGLEASDFEQYASSVLKYIEKFEMVLREAILSRSFCSTP